MCPLPLAPAKSSLLACPEGLDLRLCALQKTPLGRASQDLGEDASNTSESGALGLDLGALLKGTQAWGCRGDWNSVTGEDRAPGTLCCLCPWCAAGGQRTACRSDFSPTMWILELELRLSGLVASAFSY